MFNHKPPVSLVALGSLCFSVSPSADVEAQTGSLRSCAIGGNSICSGQNDSERSHQSVHGHYCRKHTCHMGQILRVTMLAACSNGRGIGPSVVPLDPFQPCHHAQSAALTAHFASLCRLLHPHSVRVVDMLCAASLRGKSLSSRLSIPSRPRDGNDRKVSQRRM